VVSIALVALPSTSLSADAIRSLGMTKTQVMPTATPASSFLPLTTPAPEIGPPVLIDDLVAQAREYDNKPVNATGTAENVRTDTTPQGPILQFDLCEHRCIHVLDGANPQTKNGATFNVKGVFHQHFSLGRFSQDDIVIIAPSGLPQDRSQDWRRNLEQGPWGQQPQPLDTNQP
jgi:hypothetical protein